MARALRRPLARMLLESGYEVSVETDPAELPSFAGGASADAWVFDARCHQVLDTLLATGRMLLPVDDPPEPGDAAGIRAWGSALVRQLDQALAHQRAAAGTSAGSAGWRQVQAVWLLAGSAGATSAVQQFLNAFAEPPPVAFVYAQHYDPRKQAQLEQYTVQNSAFSLVVGEGVHQLAPSRIIMIPPSCKVSVDQFGRVTSNRTRWGQYHTPDINELLYILAGARLPSPGVIVFSGMGEDGCAALKVFDAAGGRIWAQAPGDAICPGMPQAAIDTGLVHLTGTPAQLAAALEQLYGLAGEGEISR